VGAGAGLDPQRAGDGGLTSLEPKPGRLDAASWTRISAAFETLADVPAAQRERRLEELKLDPDLAARLRAMLAAHDADGVLDRALSSPPAPEPGDYASLSAGTVVGRFRVDGLIGRGGMGEVYLATREGVDFEQRVALKLLRPEAAGRFASLVGERRVLAGLEHPGIARLIDGGVADDGRAYMAMEYVEGEEIGAWRQRAAPDLATRLRLFLEVCDAVAHAHARLVIHRDLKPGNILVDSAGHARLLDFGVAKLIAGDAAETTRTEAMLTPQYAAPEQLAGGEMTVATDVYALGAVLYELLTGHGPWRDGDAEPLPTLVRRLLRDDPPAPSGAARDPVVAASRISGDLDAIVLKAMRHDPAERYASVTAMAEDIRRFQTLRPVEARAGEKAYRVRRFVRRHRWSVAAAAVIAGLVIAGVSGTLWQARQAARQRDVAVAEAERTEAVNQAMMLMFRDANDQGKTDSITARELIGNTAKRLVASLDPASPKSAAIIVALSDLYVLTEDIPSAQALLEQAAARRIGESDPEGAARMKLRLAQVYAAKKRFAEGRALLAQAAAVWAADPDRYKVERVEAASAEAYMLRQEKKPDQAIALLMRTMPDAEAAYGPNSRDLATRYSNLATHLVLANRLDEAERTIERAQSVMRNAGMANSPAGLTVLTLRGTIAARRGDLAGAEQLYRSVAATRRTLYGRSYSLAIDLLQDGRALNMLGRPAEALPLFEEAQPMAVAYVGANAEPALMAGLGRAQSLVMLGRLPEAREALAKVEPVLKAQGPASVDFGALSLVQAMAALHGGDKAAARKELDGARAAFDANGVAAAGYRTSLAALEAQAR
jgi:tetratricopeptide (TPR) repeat protein/predicted Ser/Thr protein kinase